jgi:hypothetical protein
MRIPAILFVAALAVPGLATAETVSRTQVQNGTGACQAALPNYEGNIRKRPLAISNEGTSPAFVSCSMKSDDYYAALNEYNGVQLSNRGSASANVNCTLVAGGTAPVATANYYPKSIAVPAGESVVLPWDPAVDNADAPFQNSLNWSCSLPPGVDINVVFTNIAEEVGAL